MIIKPRLRGYKAHGSSSKQIGVRLPESIITELDRIAKDTNTNRATVILRILESKLEDLKK